MGCFCRKHYEEDEAKRLRRQAGEQALWDGTIDGRLAENLGLRDELFRIRRWWFDACDAMNYSMSSERLSLDEAPYAIEWCISFAAEIVDAERALRAGKKIPQSIGYTREWVWDRFNNMERGLMSNGVRRPSTR